MDKRLMIHTAGSVLMIVIMFFCFGLLLDPEAHAVPRREPFDISAQLNMQYESDEFVPQKYAAYEKAYSVLQQGASYEYYLNYDMSYYESEEERERQRQFLTKVAEGAVEGCNTDYEKIEAICRFVAEDIYYDYMYYYGVKDTVDTYPYDVYQSKITVCQGYAELCKEFLNDIGISCAVITGEDHAFNAAYDTDNERWIVFDATWCSGNEYSVKGEFIPGDYNDWCFDLDAASLSLLGNHEMYDLILKEDDDINDTVIYLMNTPRDPKEWCDLSKWCISIDNVMDKNIRSFDLDHNEMYELPITTIGYFAFYECENLENISLPDGIQTICFGAFRLSGLKGKVILPDSITKIEDSAFSACYDLEEIILPPGLKTIDDSLFINCKKLHSISIPGRVNVIMDYAFYGCDGLRKITIPECVNIIGENAFLAVTGTFYVNRDSNADSYLTAGGYNVDYICTKGHSWDKEYVLEKEPTCISAGEKARYCSECGLADVIMVDEVDHEWGPYRIDMLSTCEQAGSESICCNICGELKEGSTRELPLIDHQYDEWDVIQEPTCGEAGEEERYCKICYHYETRAIPATGKHKWGDWFTAKKATVFSTGLKKRYCDKCDVSETLKIDKITPFVSFSSKSFKLKKGKTLNLDSKVIIGNGDRIVKWQISGKAASISKSGRVKGKKKGKAKVTVTLKSGVKGTCTIKVS